MAPAKGGVWTNIEDEILKVSVSKYGLNQWARVSSLQPRKTAKQCKARWQEWLDPSIKKTEWSKDEDEKLLHLAKVMPTQWRTIASRVGRTATQCLERYQRLLDDAEAREADAGDSFGLTGVNDEASAPTADSVRRLRPGEMDPDPESKPARPDTIDMDEDEKEMLSEARARLANTQGKKAKRKARERQLEKSKLMANLQKWREMKEAGIAIGKKPLKKGQMDYNADIPFEKSAMPGFYDTTDELNRNEKQKDGFDPRQRSITTKRKTDTDAEIEDRKRRKDDKSAVASQTAAQVAKLQRLREAEQSSGRRTLVLPAPQVGDGELEQIVKMSMAGARASEAAAESDNNATRGLVGNYTRMVDATPIRTPEVARDQDRIGNEARFARQSEATQSALLGGENTPLVDRGIDRLGGHDTVGRTPNPLATPLRTGQTGGATPMVTPRDSLRLNDGGVSGRARSVRTQLAALPAPKETEWDLEIPEDAVESEVEETVQEDATLREARLAAVQRARREAELAVQSGVIQRGLPRPTQVDVDAILAAGTGRMDDDRMEDGGDEEAQAVTAEIVREMARLMAADARSFGGDVVGDVERLHPTNQTELQEARAMVALELGLDMNDGPVELDFESTDLATDAVTIERGFKAVRADVLGLASECNGLEKRLSVRLGGYNRRQVSLADQLVSKTDVLEERRRQVTVWEQAERVNQPAGDVRLDEWRDLVGKVRRREREAQDVYRARVGM